mmetsp:Transcript_21467/g.50032  ORF Transcript_21467/g.50032 Transcript_21467/m.50032 type:complete len:486 (+) Transcript_21467:985-2442(+)
MQHDIVELSPMGRSKSKQTQNGNAHLLQAAAAIRHSDQRRPSKTLVQLLAQEDRHFSNQINAAKTNHYRADQQREVRRRVDNSANPVSSYSGAGLNRCQHLGALLGLLCLHHPCVDVFVLPGSFDLTFLLDLRPLHGLLEAKLGTALVRLEAELQELLLVLVFLRLLSQIGLLCLAEHFEISGLLLGGLKSYPLVMLLRAMLVAFALFLTPEFDGLPLFLPPKLLNASFHELHLELRFRLLPLLDEVRAGLSVDSPAEVVLKLSDCVILPGRPVLQVVHAEEHQIMTLILQLFVVGDGPVHACHGLLRLCEAELHHLHFGDDPYKLFEELLAFSPVVVLLCHDGSSVLEEFFDALIPDVCLLGQNLHRPQGCKEEVRVSDEHHVLRLVGDALGVGPSPLRQNAHGCRHDRLQLMGHDPKLSSGEELVEKLIFPMIKLTNSDVLDLLHEGLQVSVFHIVFDLLVGIQCLIYTRGALQEPIARCVSA